MDLDYGALARDSATMTPDLIVLMAASAGALAGWMVSQALAVKSRSELRQINADLDDLYERLETAQKRAASRARRAEPDQEELAQTSLPGLSNPALKERLRRAWQARRSA